MSILDRLRGDGAEPSKRSPWEFIDTPMRPASEQLKSAFDLQRVGVVGRPKYPATDVGALHTAYSRNEIVYAAIDAKASTAIDPRLLVQVRGEKSEWQEEAGHPMRRLLLEPNDYMDEAMLFASYIINLDTSGRHVEEIVWGQNKLPIALHPLNTSKLAPIPRSDGKRDWLFKDGSEKTVLKAENVLVRELWNPASKWHPIAPLAVALGSVDADNAQTDYLRAFFNHGGVPSGILKFNRRLTQEEADKAKARWRAMFDRVRGRQHDTAVLDDSANYERVGSKLDELESEAIRTFTESRIAMAFKVPPLIIYAYAGLLRSDYSNLKVAWKAFGDFTLSPLLKAYRNWRARTLLPKFVDKSLVLGERIRLWWDLTECAWAMEDANEIAARARENLKAGGWTLNQFLAATGQPTDDNGDYYIRSIATTAVAKDVLPEELMVSKSTLRVLQLKGRDAEIKASRATLERKIERKVRQHLMKDYARVAEIIASAA